MNINLFGFKAIQNVSYSYMYMKFGFKAIENVSYRNMYVKLFGYKAI